VQNLASFKTSLNFEPPAFENAARYPILKQKCSAAMSWEALSVLTHPLKLHAKTR